MPELVEVGIIRDTLRPILIGSALSVSVVSSHLSTGKKQCKSEENTALSNQLSHRLALGTVCAVESKGKNLWVRTHSDACVLIHFMLHGHIAYGGRLLQCQKCGNVVSVSNDIKSAAGAVAVAASDAAVVAHLYLELGTTSAMLSHADEINRSKTDDDGSKQPDSCLPEIKFPTTTFVKSSVKLTSSTAEVIKSSVDAPIATTMSNGINDAANGSTSDDLITKQKNKSINNDTQKINQASATVVCEKPNVEHAVCVRCGDSCSKVYVQLLVVDKMRIARVEVLWGQFLKRDADIATDNNNDNNLHVCGNGSDLATDDFFYPRAMQYTALPIWGSNCISVDEFCDEWKHRCGARAVKAVLSAQQNVPKKRRESLMQIMTKQQQQQQCGHKKEKEKEKTPVRRQRTKRRKSKLRMMAARNGNLGAEIYSQRQ